MRSIRRELLLWLLLGLVVAVVAAATSTYYQARHEARELFDYQLKQLALSVSNQRVSLVPEAQGNNRDEDFVIQIWDRDQKLFYSARPGVGILLLFGLVGLGLLRVLSRGRRVSFHGISAARAKPRLLSQFGTGVT